MNNDERKILLEYAARIIRAERKKADMSMERLAELSNVSLQTIKDIEHAKRACQIDTLAAIASTLNLSTDYILGKLNGNFEKATSDFESAYKILNDAQKEFLREITKIMLKTL